jgi:uncharacterized membrane protein
MENIKSISKTWHEAERSSRSAATKLADWVTKFVGSWTFVIIHIVWFAVWIIFKVEGFPFGLLTMIVSLEAILLSTFIMISQNRQSDRDRAQAQADYETNVSAKTEIEELQKALARIEDEKLDKILKILNSK